MKLARDEEEAAMMPEPRPPCRHWDRESCRCGGWVCDDCGREKHSPYCGEAGGRVEGPDE